MEQNMVVLPEHLVSHTMFEFWSFLCVLPHYVCTVVLVAFSLKYFIGQGYFYYRHP